MVALVTLPTQVMMKAALNSLSAAYLNNKEVNFNVQLGAGRVRQKGSSDIKRERKCGEVKTRFEVS